MSAPCNFSIHVVYIENEPRYRVTFLGFDTPWVRSTERTYEAALRAVETLARRELALAGSLRP